MFYMLLFYMILIILMLFFMFLYLLVNRKLIYLEFELMKISSMKIELLILIDWISLLFIGVVIFISLMVIFYSMEYMIKDLNINRFIMMVLMFILSMMLMILSPNLISILIGWDGLGLISFCLVIYYQSKSSFNSGMITVLTNRIGDILILMSISLLISIGSWNYMFLESMNNLIYLLMILASFTKSAQIPFSSWLPMAMAAPTPVSSLVHSSTLVTAGVYLLIRMNYLLLNENLVNLIMLISVVTMFLSGLGANFEFDLKKIIALSTLSQLGVMMFCLSLKFEEISLFHLLMHAMFKSMLFMCAGVIIHNMMGNQDIRFISMILINMPMISMLFNCSIMSLCGIPFMSGFFSKDLIMEMFLMNLFNKFIFIILFISMGLTLMYSFRLIYFSFIKVPQLMVYINYDMFNSKMGISMYLLFLMSIIKGLMLSWILFSMKNYIYLTLKFKLLIYLFMFLGLMLGILMMNLFTKMIYLNYINMIMKFMMMMWFMPMLYNLLTYKIYINFNSFIYYLELGWLEYILGGGLFNLLKNLFKYDLWNKNYFYLMIMFMFMVMLMIF